MKVSVVIRAHNEAEHIERLMLGIGAQSVAPGDRAHSEFAPRRSLALSRSVLNSVAAGASEMR